MIFCDYCRARNRPGERFCFGCGAALPTTNPPLALREVKEINYYGVPLSQISGSHGFYGHIIEKTEPRYYIPNMDSGL